MTAAVKIIPSFWKFMIAILICEGVGIASGLLSQNEINNWFSTLNKPAWNPPGYIFGPVWTTLYFLMGTSLWLIWKTKAPENHKRNAVTIFIIQLFLNFWWSLLFFKLHSPGLAFSDIVLLLISILFTIYYFSVISKLAAWLLVPYLAWVSFATALNYTIWLMNA
jgi:translocator protein